MTKSKIQKSADFSSNLFLQILYLTLSFNESFHFFSDVSPRQNAHSLLNHMNPSLWRFYPSHLNSSERIIQLLSQRAHSFHATWK